MSERGIGDFFITDAEEELEPSGADATPVVVPVANLPGVVDAEEPMPEPAGFESPATDSDASESAESPAWGEALSSGDTPQDEPVLDEVRTESAELAPAAPGGLSASADGSEVLAAPEPTAEAPAGVPVGERPVLAETVPVVASSAEAVAPSREQRLIAALDTLMADSADVQAAALVSLDGFIMASALPEGMHEDKVGAMSAAILGLGERAAVELGRGALTQVFIEGGDGYVLIMAAGDRAVLTVLAGASAKLGLVLYDMRNTSATIERLLG